jgi:hypothetical protein
MKCDKRSGQCGHLSCYLQAQPQLCLGSYSVAIVESLAQKRQRTVPNRLGTRPDHIRVVVERAMLDDRILVLVEFEEKEHSER